MRRIRQKRPIHSADKEHIHHKLLDMGLSERQILSVIYGISFYLGVVSITSVVLPEEINVYLIMVVWIGSMLGYWFLSYIDAKKHVSRVEEEVEAEQKSS
ncbi:Undecaprenyl-phosphate alpha-N-acetylglucosaminyl 1-phosphate transferase [subsurface metagenome]